MSNTNNYITSTGNNGGGNTSIPTSQPTVPGFWLDSGVLTFWSGTTNTVIDTDDGPVTDTFGVDIGIDI